MDLSNLLISLAFIPFFIGGPYLLLIWYEYKQKNSWKVVAEGVYEKIVTKSAVVRAQRIANFGIGMITVSTVFFQDGRTCVTMGIAKDLPEPGTNIRISKNGMAQFRLEVIQ